MRTPHAYKKLTDEIRTNFVRAADMKFTQLQDLPCMNACIGEGLRIIPPLPTGLTRMVPEEGDTIAGGWLPDGVTVSCHGWSTAHSPRNFHQPDDFMP
jgi:cytochrome P450